VSATMIFELLGGLGLFIYGMGRMGDGLQKAAGDSLRRLLEALTKYRIMGVFVGALVTAVIQSSSATTVMLVGFVNAGLMNLQQAVGIIMGANVGTTVTAQLIAFDLQQWAPPAIAIGVLLQLFGRRKSHRHLGQIIFGFGLLFLGMRTMSSAMYPLRSMPEFREAMVTFSRNPLLGVVVGFALTGIVQSSSATIGILQALAMQGLLGIDIALPILFGDNIGTCVTAMLSSIGTSLTARRAALMHLFFNLVGALVFLALMPLVVPIVQSSSIIAARQIANAHTMFNVANTLIQLPFAGLLVALVERVLPGEVRPLERGPKYIDRRIMETPSIALAQVVKELHRMGRIVEESLEQIMEAFLRGHGPGISKAMEAEEVVNELEHDIINYLVALSRRSLTDDQSDYLNLLQSIVNDIERIGDHTENIGELALRALEDRSPFSEQALEDLTFMYSRIREMTDEALVALEVSDSELAWAIIRQENVVDKIEERLRHAHIERLNQRLCYPASGVVFLDIISNMERIGDHTNNIAQAVLKAADITRG